MFTMFLVDVPTRTRPRPSGPPNTLAGTPASLTNCETHQRRLCRRFSVFIRKMLSFHESLFRSCPHRRPKSHPIGIPKFFDKETPLGALGTRVLASETAGKISPLLPVFGFLRFLWVFHFWTKTPPEIVYRTGFRKIRVWDTLRVWFGFG